MSEAFNHTNAFSLVKIPNNKPKNAGAMEALLPSETVGVSKIANPIIHVIPPKGLGKRFAIAYHDQSIMTLPNK